LVGLAVIPLLKRGQETRHDALLGIVAELKVQETSEHKEEGKHEGKVPAPQARWLGDLRVEKCHFF
jgi:uncharacterized protein (UPF0210 family)